MNAMPLKDLRHCGAVHAVGPSQLSLRGAGPESGDQF